MLILFRGTIVDNAPLSEADEMDYEIFYSVKGVRHRIDDSEERLNALELIAKHTSNCSFRKRYSTGQIHTIKLTEKDRNGLIELEDMIDDSGTIYFSLKVL